MSSLITLLQGVPRSTTAGSVENYIQNPSAEVNTSGWVTYSNASSSRPVNGTGGTPSVTLVRQGSGLQLSGNYSFLFTTAGTTRGQGFSTDFTIDKKDLAKVLNIQFDYMLNSGTFVAGTSSSDSDLICYLYNITDGILMEPSSFKLLSSSSTISDRFQASFQTTATATSYRLIVHCANTSAALSMLFSNFKISPSTYTYGTPITDWSAYTPVITGFGTCSNISFFSRRVGSDLQVRGAFLSGTASAVTASISIGYGGGSSNVTSDTTKLGTTVNNIVGQMGYNQGSAASFNVLAPATNQSYVQLGIQATGNAGTTPALGTTLGGGGASYSVHFMLPIVGWSSSVQTSDQTDTRICAASGRFGTLGITGTLQTLPLTTVVKDTHGAVSGNTVVIKVPGIYRIAARASISTSTADMYFQSFVNGSIVGSSYSSGTISRDVTVDDTTELKTGDVVNFSTQTGSGTATMTGAGYTSWSVTRISGPSAIAANETIAMSASKSAAQTISNSVTTEITGYDSSVNIDTHGTFNPSTGRYSIQAAGLYRVTAMAMFVANSSGYRFNQINKNGGVYQYGNFVPAVTGDSTAIFTTALVRCVAGDYISQSAFQNGATTLDIRAIGGGTVLIVERISK
jgi:hypothetical protein